MTAHKMMHLIENAIKTLVPTKCVGMDLPKGRDSLVLPKTEAEGRRMGSALRNNQGWPFFMISPLRGPPARPQLVHAQIQLMHTDKPSRLLSKRRHQQYARHTQARHDRQDKKISHQPSSRGSDLFRVNARHPMDSWMGSSSEKKEKRSHLFEIASRKQSQKDERISSTEVDRLGNPMGNTTAPTAAAICRRKLVPVGY